MAPPVPSKVTTSPATAMILDILNGSLVPQAGVAEPGCQPLIVAVGPFAVEQQSQPFTTGETIGAVAGGDVGKSLGHAEEPHLVQPIEGWMSEHVRLLQW